MSPGAAYPRIQLFPMSDDYLNPGQTIDDFFLNDLLIVSARRPTAGRFNFRTHGITAPRGSMILFQYENAVHAHAVLLDRLPPDAHSLPDSTGFFLLDPGSVCFYSQPIGFPTLQQIWPRELGHLPHLDQVPHILDLGGWNAYLAVAASRSVVPPSPAHP